MKTYIKEFPNHIEKAIGIADKYVGQFNLNNILILLLVDKEDQELQDVL